MKTLALSEMEQDVLFHAIERPVQLALAIRKQFGVPVTNELVEGRCMEIMAGVYNLDDNPWILRVILCEAVTSNTFLEELEGCDEVDLRQAALAGTSLARKVSLFTGINVKFPGDDSCSF